MTSFQIVEARPYHCGQMARRLRAAHREEFEATGGDSHRELRSVFDASSFRRAWLIDGKLAALGGVVGTSMSSAGYVWLAMSDQARKHPVAVFREARRQIAELMATKTALQARLLPGDATARRFALFLGFRPVGDDRIEYRRSWPETLAPFVVFSLPRSRSRWLASFLSYGVECGHDLPVNVGSIDELCEAIARGGSVETGLTAAWRVLRERFPDIRFAVVRRPIADVVKSAQAIGWTFPDGYLEAQEAALREISALPGTVTVDFDGLGSAEVCQALYQHCTGQLMDRRVWETMNAQNIQINPPERIRHLVTNSKRMGELFREIRETITIQAESFDTFYRDAQDLLKAHAAEAGSFDGLPLDPNIDMARALESINQLLVMTARHGGGIVGYIVFLINPSFESKNVLLGFQNIFYVRPEHRGVLGKKLRDRAISALKERGVKMLMLRSGVRARGPKLAALYEREGAKHLGVLYCLPLED